MIRASNARFTWKDRKLYLDGKNTKYSIFLHSGLTHPEFEETKLYKVRWPDGVLSEDFYNLTRAKQHVIQIARKELGVDEE